MAVTSYGRSDAATWNLWAKALEEEVLKETFIGRFMGENSSALIHKKVDTSKGPGDKITFLLRTQLAGNGVTENQTLEGNEESLTTYSDSIYINELAHAVRVKGDNTISAQRISFDMREEAKAGLKDWFQGRIDQTFMSHIAGDTVVTQGIFNGNNSTIAPTASTRILTLNSHAEGSLTTGDELTIAVIDKAVEKAKLATPLIRPLRINGGDYYVLFVHTSQVTSLRTSISTTSLTWADLQRNRVQGGEKDTNWLFEGGSYVGMYNGVLIYETTRLPQAISAGAYVANTRRAVLCGAQACSMAVGQRFTGKSMFRWVNSSPVAARAANDNRVNSGEALAA